MTKPTIALLLVAACAAPARAQIDPSRFSLAVTPVVRQYSPDAGGTLRAVDAVSPAPINLQDPSPLARTVRIELRYQITVTGSTTGSYTSGGTTYSSLGLASAKLDVAFSHPLPAGALSPAPIGTNTSAVPGFVNPAPGLDPASQTRGLYNPWRDAVTFPAQFGGGNGVLDPALQPTRLAGIMPVASAPPGQPSTQFLSSWSLYAFDAVIPQDFPYATLSFSARLAVESDGVTPSPWSFFAAFSSTVQQVVGGGPAIGGGATVFFFLPAPSSAALLALAGACAARRCRRA